VVLEMRLVDIVIVMTMEANDIARQTKCFTFNFIINFAKTIVLRCNSQLPWNHLLGEFGKINKLYTFVETLEEIF
jgi:hypothetical protein